jgi:hypothetical protein
MKPSHRADAASRPAGDGDLALQLLQLPDEGHGGFSVECWPSRLERAALVWFRCMRPAGLDIPGASPGVSPLTLPRWGLVAVGCLELI